jgi:DNA polymerase III subunit gamma/tau
MPQSFVEVIELFDRRREAVIAAHLKANIHLVAFEPGRIELHPTGDAPSNLINQLSQHLMEWTGERWLIARSDAEGAPTLAEQEVRRAGELRNEVASHPLVRAVLDTFPGATIAAVRERFVAGDSDAEPAAEDIPAEFEDDGASASGDET